MRLVTINDSKGRRAGLQTDGAIVDLSIAWPAGPRRVVDILAQGRLEELREISAKSVPAEALLPADVTLWAPVDRPGKIVCLGLNFHSHAEENDKPLPTAPLLFSKAVTALNGPTGDIVIPQGTDKVDWEVELCVVIGRTCKKVSEGEALSYVAGYTVMNDVSARDWQFAASQWHRGKSPDTFAPMGPALVTIDEAGPWQKMDLTCRLYHGEAGSDAGQVVQQANAGEDIIFTPEATISYISQFMTLEAGDCISLGTPSGVGHYREPPIYLQPGDVVECEISGLGRIRNRVRS